MNCKCTCECECRMHEESKVLKKEGRIVSSLGRRLLSSSELNKIIRKTHHIRQVKIRDSNIFESVLLHYCWAALLGSKRFPKADGNHQQPAKNWSSPISGFWDWTCKVATWKLESPSSTEWIWHYRQIAAIRAHEVNTKRPFVGVKSLNVWNQI